ncbi:MAG: hypothetical protein V2A55_01145 [Candidatus Jorgensenbacteria bacterium]
MKKTLTIVIIVIVLALVIWFIFRSPEPVFSPEAGTTGVLGGDTTSAINNDLNSLDLGDLDSEFQQIDADLNQL